MKILRSSRFSNADRVQNICHSIYVTNFPDSATSRDLWNACSVYGTVVDDCQGGEGREGWKRLNGCGFVVFGSGRGRDVVLQLSNVKTPAMAVLCMACSQKSTIIAFKSQELL
nr:RNA-directed DNA polymerase, eukaryota, nucleotide-binding alpha-beta plait domain protein [Tanacetum cinerariifolium]